jgi:hypothetical protein
MTYSHNQRKKLHAVIRVLNARKLPPKSQRKHLIRLPMITGDKKHQISPAHSQDIETLHRLINQSEEKDVLRTKDDVHTERLRQVGEAQSQVGSHQSSE